MEDRIVVKKSSKDLIESLIFAAGTWIFFGAFWIWDLCDGGGGTGLCWVFLCAFAISSLVAANAAIVYFRQRLELSYHACSYQTAFGRKREFLPEDVAVVKTKMMASGGERLSLVRHDGTCLAEIDLSMVHAEQVIPFFELYNASAVRTEEGWCYSQKVAINTYGEELIVKSDGRGKWAIYFLGVIYLLGLLLILLFLQDAWIEKSPGRILLAIGLIVLIFLAFVSLRKGMEEQKKICLRLTTGLCSYTDGEGKKREFSFDEIKCVNRRRRTGIKNSDIINYFEIVLKSGEIAAEIKWNDRLENSTEIERFVAYHVSRQKREMERCGGTDR